METWNALDPTVKTAIVSGLIGFIVHLMGKKNTEKKIAEAAAKQSDPAVFAASTTAMLEKNPALAVTIFTQAAKNHPLAGPELKKQLG